MFSCVKLMMSMLTVKVFKFTQNIFAIITLIEQSDLSVSESLQMMQPYCRTVHTQIRLFAFAKFLDSLEEQSDLVHPDISI